MTAATPTKTWRPCLHCGKTKFIYRRGLCTRCCKTPGVKEGYPVPDPAPLARLMRLVRLNPGTKCWEWAGRRKSPPNYPYGQMRFNGRTALAHKVSYELHVGPVPDGVFVLHKCDNPPCVNPKHLFLGTQVDNMQDRFRKGRRRVDPVRRA